MRNALLPLARRLACALGMSVLLAPLGCLVGGVRVVSQADPDPFVGQRRFGALHLDYGDAHDADGDAHAEDRESLQDGFSMALRGKAASWGIRVTTADGVGDAPFLLRTRVTSFEPGADGKSSHVKLEVSIVDGSGRVLDELVLAHGNELRSGRMRTDGIALGEALGLYLQSRVGKISGPAPDDEDGAPSPPSGVRPSPRDGGLRPPNPQAQTRAPADRSPRRAAPADADADAGLVVERPPQVAVGPPPMPQQQAPGPPPVAVVREPPPRRPARPAPPRAHGPVRAPPKGTPIASFPGFTRLEDGRSRVWVEVDHKVEVTASRSPLQIVYRLRGAAIVGVTNELPLVTGYYTTPVDRAQLIPAGADLELVIDLREVATPTSAVVETPRGIVLWVDFPKSTRPPPDLNAPMSPPPPPHR